MLQRNSTEPAQGSQNWDELIRIHRPKSQQQKVYQFHDAF